jgi:hypothetical protein
MDRRTVARSVPEGMTLIDYVRGRLVDAPAAHFLAFVRLGGEGSPLRLIDLGAAEPLDRALAEGRASLVATIQGLRQV